jgi:hypothetical protein
MQYTISRNPVVDQAHQRLKSAVALAEFYYPHIVNEFTDEVHHQLCKEVAQARVNLRSQIEKVYRGLN